MHPQFLLAASALFLAACLNDEPTAPGGSSATEAGPAGPAFAVIGSAPTDLGTLGGPLNWAFAINARGQIVGLSMTTSRDDHAFLWQDGVMTDISGGKSSRAYGMSDAGHIVGGVNAPALFHAALWHSGTMHDLGTLPGDDESLAYDVNQTGQVVGYSGIASLEGGGDRPTLWTNGLASDLGTLVGGSSGRAYGINSKGHVVGYSETSNEGPVHAFLYINGTMRDLSVLSGRRTSAARAINAYDQVVGGSDGHAFLWEGGKMRDLGTLDGLASIAYDVNDNGQVVGESGSRAFVWYNGVMSSLAPLGGSDSWSAQGINAAGQVVGYSSQQLDGSFHAVRWTLPPVNFWTGRASLPAARREAAVAVANGLVYVLGGVNSAGTALKTVVIYNPSTNAWSTGVSMPAPRQAGSGAAVIGNMLYVVGGYDAAGTLTGTLYAYNLTTKTWSTRASLPVPSGCGGARVISTQLYVFTGCTRSGAGGTTRVGLLHRYSPPTNTWTTLRTAPAAHYQPAVAVLNDRLYVAGGIDAAGNLSKRLDVYTPSSNSWSKKADMPTARRGAAGAAVGKRFHVIGGQTSAGYLATVEAYEPATNFWVPRAGMGTARAGLAVGVVDGLGYAVGGRTSTGAVTANQRYTP